MLSTLDFAVGILGVLAAWSLGHHYSAAVVGTAFGSNVIGTTHGLVLAGIFVVLGSLVTSVVSTYVSLAAVGGVYSVVVLLTFVVMTNLTTYLKIPTSTIQLYAFSLLGTAVAIGAQVDYWLFALLIFSWPLHSLSPWAV